MEKEALIAILQKNLDYCTMMIDSDHPRAWEFFKAKEALQAALHEVHLRS